MRFNYQPQKSIHEVCCLCARTNLVTWVEIIRENKYISKKIKSKNKNNKDRKNYINKNKYKEIK